MVREFVFGVSISDQIMGISSRPRACNPNPSTIGAFVALSILNRGLLRSPIVLHVPEYGTIGWIYG
jgi:hypothetical protein